MNELEFIIALTDHRFLGKVFQPYLIRKSEKFYTVVRLVRPHDFDTADYQWKPWEKELVNITEKYSDERLMKRFSKAGSVANFYSTLDSGIYQRQVVPYIEKAMMEVISILMLSPVRLLNKEFKYSNLYDEDEIQVPPFFAKPEFHFERTEIQTRYKLIVKLDGKELSLSESNCIVVTNDPCLLLYRNQLIAFEKLNAKKLMPFFGKEYVSVPNTMEDKYYTGFVLKTIRDYKVKAKGFEIKEEAVKQTAELTLETSLQEQPVLVLRFYYGNESFLPHSGKQTAVSWQKTAYSYVFYKTARDPEWEQGILEFLMELGLQSESGSLTPQGVEALEKQQALYYVLKWMSENRVKLEKHGITIRQEESDKKYFVGKRELEIKTQTKGDWFDVYAVVRFGDFSIPFIRLKKYILNDIHEFELPNGEIAVLPDEWFARYKGLLPFGKDHGQNIRFQKHHFTLLQETIRETNKELKQRYLQLIQAEKEKIAVPKNVKAKLRTYQEEGFNWMYGLYKNGMGGCLADDMGLGKTLQTLTLLLKLKRRKRSIHVSASNKNSAQLDIFAEQHTGDETIQPASLIVLPTSLVHNWYNEIQKFTPSLKVFNYTGIQRKKVEDIGQVAKYYDVILTTYGTVRNDFELLSKTGFFYVILDESQSIKNSGSKTYKAIMGIKAKHKLVLTGTPIENSLSDLWSQMNFLNPGLLGSLAFFRRSFITPIEKYGNEEQQQRLQLMIRPFVLRRTKAEVARDLPPLMEEVRFCPMEGGQQRMYDKEKSVIRNTILSAIEKDGVNKSQFVVLQGLTRLRQLANHPLLFENDSTQRSGKYEEIFRMLENLVAEKHKVLIFSSFVSHLELLEKGIRKYRWKYSKLTGQTRKREEVIMQFQDDAENRIFLISLKAGGVGLNLVEADYVFIIDPWWNPAAENQAINRAHRIGQDKHVFVYRFITGNSIEEKIQQLKARKSALANAFVNSNDPFQQISNEELVELFK